MPLTSRRALAVPPIVALGWLTATARAAAHGGPVVRSSGALTDLQPATSGLPGARSVVIHAMETDHPTGWVGGRLACLPVVW